jgi:hypothetical protein
MDDSYRQVNIWIIDADCRFPKLVKQVNFVLSSLCWGTLGMFSNDIPFWGTHFLADAGLWKFFQLLRLTNPFWPSSHVHYNMYTDYLCSLFWNMFRCYVSRIFDFSLHFPLQKYRILYTARIRHCYITHTRRQQQQEWCTRQQQLVLKNNPYQNIVCCVACVEYCKIDRN